MVRGHGKSNNAIVARATELEDFKILRVIKDYILGRLKYDHPTVKEVLTDISGGDMDTYC